MSALRLLALSYLASASVFVMAAGLVAHPQTAGEIAAALRAVTQMALENMQPAEDRGPVVRLALAPPKAKEVARRLAAVAPSPRMVQPPQDRLADFPAPTAIIPDLSPESAPVPPEPTVTKPQVPSAGAGNDLAAAPAWHIPEPPPWSEGASRSGNEIGPVISKRATAATMRLKASLTPEMLQNFDLFLYVSKVNHGPLGQRMLVFRKQVGALQLAYDWAVSTGREQDEISPRGRSTFTATPRGYYELDPQRMYRRYHSWNWNQDMPDAMFFNWERQGLQTGLAIHSATGDDVARLGSRASAGCVHLAPENAALLYDLIRADYRGEVPRFAYNGDTQTMSNRGDFMHRRDGRLQMRDGYRVLVVIDDYGGDNVAALD
jgi:hypothetical protein